MDLGWPVVVSSLLFLSYGAWAIAREKDLYSKTAIKTSIGSYQVLLPAWWSLIGEQLSFRSPLKPLQQMTFYRSDTDYDWRSSLGLFEASEHDLNSLLSELVEQLELEFDPEALKALPWARTKLPIEAVRIEGTATHQGENRVYADLLLVRLNQSSEIFYLWSISSILNGCVEGPYVEEVIKNLLFNNQPINNSDYARLDENPRNL